MNGTRVTLVILLVLVGVSVFMIPAQAAMSQIRGTVYWYDQYDNLRPLPWVQVVATPQEGEPTYASSTTDGAYVMWVAPGSYTLSVSSDPGFVPQTYDNVVVSDGGVVVVDFQLEPTGDPIPEYPLIVQPILVFVAALAAAVMIRRSRRT